MVHVIKTEELISPKKKKAQGPSLFDKLLDKTDGCFRIRVLAFLILNFLVLNLIMYNALCILF